MDKWLWYLSHEKYDLSTRQIQHGNWNGNLHSIALRGEDYERQQAEPEHSAQINELLAEAVYYRFFGILDCTRKIVHCLKSDKCNGNPSSETRELRVWQQMATTFMYTVLSITPPFRFGVGSSGIVGPSNNPSLDIDSTERDTMHFFWSLAFSYKTPVQQSIAQA